MVDELRDRRPRARAAARDAGVDLVGPVGQAAHVDQAVRRERQAVGQDAGDRDRGQHRRRGRRVVGRVGGGGQVRIDTDELRRGAEAGPEEAILVQRHAPHGLVGPDHAVMTDDPLILAPGQELPGIDHAVVVGVGGGVDDAVVVPVDAAGGGHLRHRAPEAADSSGWPPSSSRPCRRPCGTARDSCRLHSRCSRPAGRCSSGPLPCRSACRSWRASPRRSWPPRHKARWWAWWTAQAGRCS